MIRIDRKLKLTKVVLVTYPDDFILHEAKQLILSIPEYEIVKIFTQKYLNHSKYGMGSGKAEEIEKFVKETKEIEEIIVDDHLSSKQIYNLEKLIGVSVKDRERLILDIFYTRATTVEAKLQIQLAEIEYEMPRVRENAKLLTNSKERAGKGGMGEYIVDVRFRDLKRQMSFIKEKINDAKLKRDIYQHQRQKTRMPVVSLVGYTSSGKTTLFNLLTNASKSTLEESLVADLILLLIDSSEDIEDVRIKYSNCLQILEELNVDKSKLFTVLTKVDKIDTRMIDETVGNLRISNDVIAISAKTGYGIHKLKTLLMKKQFIET